jgi:hypothetical protein
MTLLPSAPLGVRGHPGNAYNVRPTCSHPQCARPAQHVHHCWPRSFLRKQPIEWVKYEDGTVVGNRLGFCVEHHDMLTGEIGGYRARLLWIDGEMWWEDRSPDNVVGNGQRFTMEATGPTEKDFTTWIRLGKTWPQPPIAGRDLGDVAHGHQLVGEEEVCPTCGHHKRSAADRDVAKPGKLRPTKEWTVLVPDDSEIGADLMDEWIEDFAIAFGIDHYTSRLKRYHVLSLLRGVTLSMRSDIIAMVAEAAGRRTT